MQLVSLLKIKIAKRKSRYSRMKLQLEITRDGRLAKDKHARLPTSGRLPIGSKLTRNRRNRTC